MSPGSDNNFLLPLSLPDLNDLKDLILGNFEESPLLDFLILNVLLPTFTVLAD